MKITIAIYLLLGIFNLACPCVVEYCDGAVIWQGPSTALRLWGGIASLVMCVLLVVFAIGAVFSGAVGTSFRKLLCWCLGIYLLLGVFGVALRGPLRQALFERGHTHFMKANAIDVKRLSDLVDIAASETNPEQDEDIIGRFRDAMRGHFLCMVSSDRGDMRVVEIRIGGRREDYTGFLGVKKGNNSLRDLSGKARCILVAENVLRY